MGKTALRLRLLVVFFLGSLSYACSDRDAEPGAFRGSRGSVPVVVVPAASEVVRTRVDAVGTARARRSVSLYPEAAGEVVSVTFDPDDYVREGAVLVALDSRDEALALELAELRLAEAQRLFERYSKANSNVELTVPETTVDTARTALASARIERDRAKLALERRFVTAPFDGFVGITEIDSGDRIDPSTEIATFDDREVLLVNFVVPEAFVGRLRRGDPVHIELWGDEQTRASGTIVAIDSRIDPLSRAFIARAEVPNGDDLLRPGMSFRVQLELIGGTYAAVPEVAVQWGADGAYVWTVVGGVAQRSPVALVQRQQGRVLIKGDLAEGALIVAEGMQALREGVSVRIIDAADLARDVRDALAPGVTEERDRG